VRKPVRKSGSRQSGQVFTVTGLPTSIKDDQSARMRRYLLSMGIRTACFVLAVFTLTVLHWTVVGWVLVAGAVVLPYIAVVMANATRSQGSVRISPPRADEEPPDEPGSVPPR